MIDSRILAGLQSRNDNPAYTVIVTGYDNTEDCNQEKLIIHLHQINKSLEYIENIDGVNVLSKDLIIKSDLDYNEDGFKTILTGYSNSNGSIKPSEISENDLMSHYIEMIDTKLDEEVQINFQKTFQKMPHVIITIDKKYKSYYSSYDLEFNIEDELYKGVKITFNKLRKKHKQPDINIAIIGDKIE